MCAWFFEVWDTWKVMAWLNEWGVATDGYTFKDKWGKELKGKGREHAYMHSLWKKGAPYELQACECNQG